MKRLLTKGSKIKKTHYNSITVYTVSVLYVKISVLIIRFKTHVNRGGPYWFVSTYFINYNYLELALFKLFQWPHFLYNIAVNLTNISVFVLFIKHCNSDVIQVLIPIKFKWIVLKHYMWCHKYHAVTNATLFPSNRVSSALQFTFGWCLNFRYLFCTFVVNWEFSYN
jgi:hypothetical protein